MRRLLGVKTQSRNSEHGSIQLQPMLAAESFPDSPLHPTKQPQEFQLMYVISLKVALILYINLRPKIRESCHLK